MRFTDPENLRFLKSLWPTRVRTQLILGVALVHLLFMTVFIFVMVERQRTFLLDQTMEHVKSLAAQLAANSTPLMITNDVSGLSELVEQRAHYHIVRSMMIVDTEGKVLAHSDTSLLGKYLKDGLSRSLLKAEPKSHVLRADSRDFDVAAPILTKSGKCLGWARIIHDRKYVDKSLHSISIHGIIYTLLAILTGSLFATWIGNRLTAELNELSSFAAMVKEGRHDLRVDIPSGYEAGRLAEGFNQMLDALETRGRENADLRNILDNMTEGCLIIGFDWTFLYVNAAAARQKSKSREELLGRRLPDVFPRAEGSRLFTAYRQCMEGRVHQHLEVEHTFKDGRPRWYELHVEPVAAGIFVLSLDITESRKMQKHMLEQSLILEAFFNDTITPFAILDRNYNFTRVNSAYAKAWRRDIAEFPGHNHFEFFPSDIKYIFDEVVRTKTVYQAYAKPFTCTDHPELGVSYWDWVLFPILDAQKEVKCLVFSLRNVTERKQAEEKLQELNTELEQRVISRTEDLRQANTELKELDNLKSMFIASISHELRTPLNSIIGFSSILLKEWCGPANKEQKKNMAIILAAGKHLHMLINDVIDVSKIEAGKIEVFVEDFDLYDLVSEALRITGDEKDANRLTVRNMAAHQAMHTDRRRLLQCVINLLSNAVKFTIKGTVTIRTEIVKSPDSSVAPDIAEITVTDNGIGIKAEDIPRLFSPFIRLTSPLANKTTGTGLGLYLVKKIATEVLKGEVSVKSVYGKGCSFLLRIPIILKHEE